MTRVHEHHGEPLAHRDLGRRRVLAVQGETLYAARGWTLERSLDGGLTYDDLARATASASEHLMASTSLSRRLFRTGFHHLLPLNDGALSAVLRGRVLHLAPGERRFTTAHRVTRGTRPLSLCRSASGRVWFGEYFANDARNEVHVYGSDDGRSFDVAYSFPAGAIRHVHGIQRDPHRGGLWVMTGDEGDEVGLWWTDDEFRTLEPVLRGEQSARAVSVLCTADGLIVPTDTPQECNWIQHFDPRSGRLERLHPLIGSCFATATSRGVHYLSTAVEKSAVNTEPSSALYASVDGLAWTEVARYRRDLHALRDRRGYLQYPTLLLPSGESRLPYLFATAQALSGLHGRTLRFAEGDVRERLRAPDARAA